MKAREGEHHQWNSRLQELNILNLQSAERAAACVHVCSYEMGGIYVSLNRSWL